MHPNETHHATCTIPLKQFKTGATVSLKHAKHEAIHRLVYAAIHWTKLLENLLGREFLLHLELAYEVYCRRFGLRISRARSLLAR